MLDSYIILQGGFTALYLAAQEGNKDVVSMLLRAGASEKIVNSVSFLILKSSSSSH